MPIIDVINSFNKLGKINYDATEQDTGNTYFGKPIYTKTFTGTAPNVSGLASTLFTVTGATKIIDYYGMVTQNQQLLPPPLRHSHMAGVQSGYGLHGPFAQFWGNDFVVANYAGAGYTNDTRFSNCNYEITVFYTK